MMKRIICPVCNKENDINNVIFNRDFSEMRTIVPYLKYNVYECDKCGMIYAGDVEESMPIDEYYNVLSKYEDNNFTLSPVISAFYERVADFLEGNINKEAKILDIGCAFGGLLYSLKKRGYNNLAGVEPSKNNCEYAMNHFGIKVYHGALGYENELTALVKTRFDLIIMSGVLEHIYDLKKALQEAKKLLDEAGMICIIVPDAELFCDNTDLYQEFSTEHINYFNISSLKQLFSRAGMKCMAQYQDKICFYGLAGNIMTLWKMDKNKEAGGENIDNSAIRKYLLQCAAVADKVRQKITTEDLKNGIYIWCAGTMTAMLYQLGIVTKDSVKVIVDSNLNYQGYKIFGHTVESPEVLKGIPELPIVIASQYAQKAIEKQIKVWGLKNKVIGLFDGA